MVGMWLNLSQPIVTAFPDLLCVKGNDVKFIEVKAKNGKLSPLQDYRINELKSYGIKVEVAFANDWPTI